MTVEEKKLSIIAWIAQLKNDQLIEEIARIVNSQDVDVPEAIKTLLVESQKQIDQDNWTNHSSARTLIR